MSSATEATESTHEDVEREAGDRGLVAFFMPSPGYGGAQQVTINIANGLAAAGYTVDLVVASADGETASTIEPAVRVVDLSVPSVPGLGVLAAIPSLRSYLNTSQPLVLFTAQTHANVAATLAARLVRPRPHVAVTEHVAYERVQGQKDRFTKWLAGHVYRFADDVVAVSHGVAESIVASTGLGPERTTVLYNPIDIDEIHERSAEPPDHEWFDDPELRPVVSVSRLEPQKDLGTLLRAFRTVNETRPETRLVVVGKGTERERLITLAGELGLEDVVSFPGYVENQYAYMGGSAVYVLSSRFEGLPTVLVEALAAGCSVVATDCPYGPDEILGSGEYGRLTPVGDAAALAEAVLATLDEPVPDARAFDRAQAFSMAAGISRYDDYIQSVLESQ